MNAHLKLTWNDLGETYDGPHATPKRIAEGPYFLNISSLSGGRLDLTQSDHVSEDEFIKWTRRVTPQVDDLLFSYETRLGEAALMPDGIKACLGRRMALLRPNRDVIYPKFLLYYYLSPNFQRIIEQNIIHGATVNRISLSTMGKWPISIPHLKEQRAIAEALGALDDKITANIQLVETSSQFSNALFKASLTESAVEAKLSEICTLLSRGITPKYSESDDSMIVLNQKCVRQQRVDVKQSRRTEFFKVREEKILLHDDVLVNSTGQGTLGRVARWTFPEKVTVDSHITILRFDPELVNPVCGGFAVLRSEKVITSMAEGSTGQTELSRSELGKLKILLPPPEIQNALGQELSEIAAFNDGLIRENQQLSETRDTLLPQLMSGKIRVREAESIVEDVL